MRYANVLLYVADPDAVAEARPVHRAYMADFKRQGKLAAGGPFDDLTGRYSSTRPSPLRKPSDSRPRIRTPTPALSRSTRSAPGG